MNTKSKAVQTAVSLLIVFAFITPLSIQAETPQLDPNRALAATPSIIGGVVDDSYGSPIGMDPSACFSVSDSEGDVPGSCSYNDSDHSITFIPDLPLKGGMTYTANAAGLKDGGGDFQQVSKSWSFTTKKFVYILPLIYK